MAGFTCVIWKVEHGSAAFIRTPNGRTIIFDAGCSDDFSPATYLHTQYGLDSKNNKPDLLIISHPDKDHIQDLPTLYKLIPPKSLSRNKLIPDEAIYPSGTKDLKEPLKTYFEMNNQYTCPCSDYNKFEPITNWGNVLMKTFSCTPEHIGNGGQDKIKNNLSLVSYVRYLNTEIIFPGDLEPIGWQMLFEKTKFTEYAGSATYRLLVAPHHGRKSGICFKRDGNEYVYQKIFDVLKPDFVIMSDKWGNETTVPEKYMPHINSGLHVKNGSKNTFEVKKVLTTKTNSFVLIKKAENEVSEAPYVAIP